PASVPGKALARGGRPGHGGPGRTGRDRMQFTVRAAPMCSPAARPADRGNDRMGFLESQLSESREREFIRRVYRMRTLGMALGALPVAAVLRENGAPAWTWGLLLFNGF